MFRKLFHKKASKLQLFTEEVRRLIAAVKSNEIDNVNTLISKLNTGSDPYVLTVLFPTVYDETGTMSIKKTTPEQFCELIRAEVSSLSEEQFATLCTALCKDEVNNREHPFRRPGGIAKWFMVMELERYAYKNANSEKRVPDSFLEQLQGSGYLRGFSESEFELNLKRLFFLNPVLPFHVGDYYSKNEPGLDSELQSAWARSSSSAGTRTSAITTFSGSGSGDSADDDSSLSESTDLQRKSQNSNQP